MKEQSKLDLVTIRLRKERTLKSDKIITDTYSAVELLKEELEDYDREVFVVLNLNSKGFPINASITSIGDISSSIVHPREVFKSAVLSNASAIILMHNHPSGICIPSEDDCETTERMVLCGKIMGITVLDHIIVAGEKSLSFREKGIVFDDDILNEKKKNQLKKELDEESEI